MSDAGVAAIERFRADFRSLLPTLPGRDCHWVESLRRNAISRFTELGFPTPRDEDWKYTKLSAIEGRAFRAADPHPAPNHTDIERFCLPASEFHRLVFVDGHYAADLSDLHDLGGDVEVGSMAAALAQGPESLEFHLARYADVDRHPFAALNTAFMGDGAFIHLKRRAVLARPLHLLFVSSASQPDCIMHPRVLIVGEVASRACVVESFVSLRDGVYFNNPITEIMLKPGACVEHYKIQRESAQAYHVSTIHVEQEHDTQFTSHAVSLGARLSRTDINARLRSEGATCQLNGLFLASGHQHVDFHTAVDHISPAGTSDEYYKGILDGRARGVFNGRVYVHPDAQQTDAHQKSFNLLLSNHAEIDTKPQLEIYADDVKCSHGATVGQLDERMLFYLRSRGIDEAQARALLIFGFAADVLDRIQLPALRQQLVANLLEWMPSADRLKGIMQ